jgi:hypothetical protein
VAKQERGLRMICQQLLQCSEVRRRRRIRVFVLGVITEPFFWATFARLPSFASCEHFFFASALHLIGALAHHKTRRLFGKDSKEMVTLVYDLPSSPWT